MELEHISQQPQSFVVFDFLGRRALFHLQRPDWTDKLMFLLIAIDGEF